MNCLHLHRAFRRTVLSCICTALFILPGALIAAQPKPVPQVPPLITMIAHDGGIENALRDYLMAHGDVILQAIQAYQQKQQADAQKIQATQVVANQKQLEDGPVGGNPQGDIEIVEFFDNQCPFCKHFAPDLNRAITENSRVKVIYKEFPILDSASRIASQYALAAVRQGKYIPFHNALMADNTAEHQLNEPHIIEIAKSVGLDVEKLKVDRLDPAIEKSLNDNIALGTQLGVRGTPTLVIGGKLVMGAQPYETLKTMLAAQVKP